MPVAVAPERRACARSARCRAPAGSASASPPWPASGLASPFINCSTKSSTPPCPAKSAPGTSRVSVWMWIASGASTAAAASARGGGVKRQPATTARMRDHQDAFQQDRSPAAAACSIGSRAPAPASRESGSAPRAPSRTTTSASLISRMMPYLVSISAPKLSSWTIGEHEAGQRQHATTGTRMRENRFSTGSNGSSASPRHRRQRRQRADPEGDGNAVEEHGGRGQPLRRRGRGVTAGGQRKPDAGHGDAGQHPGDRHRSGFARRTARSPSPRSRSAATARGWCASALFHGASDTRPLSGRSSRSRPCRPSDATALTRPMRSARDDQPRAARARIRSRRRRTRRRRRQTGRDRPRSAPARSGRQRAAFAFGCAAAPVTDADRKHQRSRRRDGRPARPRGS